MQPCKLCATPGDVVSDFRAAPGDVVTIAVSGQVGVVQFLAVSYNGQPLSGLPSNQITFVIAVGVSLLDIVYGFSDVDGRGTLNEVCGQNTPLGLVNAGNPVSNLRILAAGPHGPGWPPPDEGPAGGG